MKLFLMLTILILFSLVGYEIKNKYKKQKDLLLYLKLFLQYYKTNIVVLKNDFHEIWNSYKKMNGKKYEDLFLEDNKIIELNKNFVEEKLYDKQILELVIRYFDSFGKSDILTESENINSILTEINVILEKTNEDIKSKGDLYFKLFIAIGLVVIILFW